MTKSEIELLIRQMTKDKASVAKVSTNLPVTLPMRRSMYRQLTLKQQKQIARLYEEFQLSHIQISAMLNINRFTVANVLKRYIQNGRQVIIKRSNCG